MMNNISRASVQFPLRVTHCIERHNLFQHLILTGPMSVCDGIVRPKWVITHKNQTIQLVGPVLKQYSLLATRASEARFPGPKSSLWGSVSACLVAGFHVDKPRGIWPRGSRVSETRFTKSETESQKLEFQSSVTSHVWLDVCLCACVVIS